MERSQDFLITFKPAVDLLRSHVEIGDIVRIITHNDADGMASGGILSNTVCRLGTPFKITVEKRLDTALLKRLRTRNLKL